MKPLYKNLFIVLFLVIIFVLIVIMIIYFCDYEKYGELVVNNTSAIQQIHIHKRYAELPFIKVLEMLDIKVEYLDDNIVQIQYNDRCYNLNLLQKTLCKYGDSDNLIEFTPGQNTPNICEVRDGELYLDSITLKSTLFFMGINIDINVDYSHSAVYVTNH